jgi:hypothetical protein
MSLHLIKLGVRALIRCKSMYGVHTRVPALPCFDDVRRQQRGTSVIRPINW